MTAQIIDGKAISVQILEELKPRVKALDEKGVVPGLSVVILGDDPASLSYVRSKGRACQKLGMRSETIELPAETGQEELLALIGRLNADPKVHGLLVQLPLPGQIDEAVVIETIDPAKDVDGFTPTSLGRLLAGQDCFSPATAAGVIELLKRSGNPPDGKHVIIVGRSNIVGKPLAALLIQKREGANATVTVCHSRTKDLETITKTADILVAAVGSPNFVKADMVKEDAVVIDVGVNRVDEPSAKGGYRLVGDVYFETVSQKAGAITPVPGGVGPMTVAMLLSNLVRAAELDSATGK
jgi:methylenetetrahydrofolate dehydrogenase (NADP+)/methenyltetrahydrofolate cyclohydrolase